MRSLSLPPTDHVFFSLWTVSCTVFSLFVMCVEYTYSIGLWYWKITFLVQLNSPSVNCWTHQRQRPIRYRPKNAGDRHSLWVIYIIFRWNSYLNYGQENIWLTKLEMLRFLPLVNDWTLNMKIWHWGNEDAVDVDSQKNPWAAGLRWLEIENLFLLQRENTSVGTIKPLKKALQAIVF